MELFGMLFSSLLLLAYHCFDRIAIHGDLSGLSRPEQVVYFLRQVRGIRAITTRIRSSSPTAGWKQPSTTPTARSLTSLSYFKRPNPPALTISLSVNQFLFPNQLAFVRPKVTVWAFGARQTGFQQPRHGSLFVSISGSSPVSVEGLIPLTKC